jgi:hypothetical protein
MSWAAQKISVLQKAKRVSSELLHQVLTPGDKLEERRGADSGTDSNPVEAI